MTLQIKHSDVTPSVPPASLLYGEPAIGRDGRLYIGTYNGSLDGAGTVTEIVGTNATPTFLSVTFAQATGTKPFTVSSVTMVDNLNVELLGGHNAAYFQVAGLTLLLDQTTPQVVANGLPYFSTGLRGALYDVAGVMTYTSHIPTLDTTHVVANNYLSTLYYPYFTCTPAGVGGKTLDGPRYYNQWLTSDGPNNHCFYADLGSAQTVVRIYYENGHSSGGETTRGARAFTLWGANSPTDFASPAWVSDAQMVTNGWTQLTCDVSEFVQHSAVDAADPHYVAVTNTVAYRYYGLKIATAWGGDLVGIRLLEFQTGVGTPVKSVDSNARKLYSTDGTTQMFAWAGGIGFYGTAPAAKPTVGGSRGSNAALASLLTALAGLGLVTDSSS